MNGDINVLNLISVHPPFLKGKWWSCEDLLEKEGFGTIVRLYNFNGERDDNQDVAYIIVADVTEDPEEPDIATFTEDDVLKYDKVLEKSLDRIFSKDGRKMIKWMSSHLSGKTLTTAYIEQEQNKDRQVIVLRLPHANRKMIIMGRFDIEHKNELSTPIFHTMKSFSLLDRTEQ
jgi:hypothetical protein